MALARHRLRNWDWVLIELCQGITGQGGRTGLALFVDRIEFEQKVQVGLRKRN